MIFDLSFPYHPTLTEESYQIAYELKENLKNKEKKILDYPLLLTSRDKRGSLRTRRGSFESLSREKRSVFKYDKNAGFSNNSITVDSFVKTLHQKKKNKKNYHVRNRKKNQLKFKKNEKIGLGIRSNSLDVDYDVARYRKVRENKNPIQEAKRRLEEKENYLKSLRRSKEKKKRIQGEGVAINMTNYLKKMRNKFPDPKKKANLDPNEISNRLHFDSRERKKRRKLEEKENYYGFFKPFVNESQQFGLNNVDRLLNIVDMRLNSLPKKEEKFQRNLVDKGLDGDGVMQKLILKSKREFEI